MTAHIKVDGSWLQASRLHHKVGGTWVPVQEGYVKRSGVWVKFYELDVTPPTAPLITLSIETTRYGPQNKNIGRHIRVNVQVPGANDPSIQLVRVLTTYQGKQPATQFGATYTAASDERFPFEPWSEWRYGAGLHPDTSAGTFKTWPRSAPPSSQLVDNQIYHFSGWTLDENGNWSAATHAQIKAPPKGDPTFDTVKKETKFSAIWTGTISADGSFVVGPMTQQGSPLKRGVLGYGNAVEDEVGAAGLATIKSCQVRLVRSSSDTGAASADIYVATHQHTTYGSGAGWLTYANPVKLGTLAKGEAKWFDVPASHQTLIENGNFRGFVFLEKAPNAAAAQAGDYSILKSSSEAPAQGQLHIIWEEVLT